MQLRVTLLSPGATFEIPLCFSLYLCASVVVRAVQIDLTRLRSHFRLYICRAFGARAGINPSPTTEEANVL